MRRLSASMARISRLNEPAGASRRAPASSMPTVGARPTRSVALRIAPGSAHLAPRRVCGGGPSSERLRPPRRLNSRRRPVGTLDGANVVELDTPCSGRSAQQFGIDPGTHEEPEPEQAAGEQPGLVLDGEVGIHLSTLSCILQSVRQRTLDAIDVTRYDVLAGRVERGALRGDVAQHAAPLRAWATGRCRESVDDGLDLGEPGV